MDLTTILTVVLPSGGLALLGLAVAQAARTRRTLARCAIAQGTVVGAVAQPDESQVYHFPRVRFRTADGREVEFQSQLGSSVPAETGSATSVRYERERPERAEIDTFATRWMPSIVLGTLGDALLMIGVGLWVGWIRV